MQPRTQPSQKDLADIDQISLRVKLMKLGRVRPHSSNPIAIMERRTSSTTRKNTEKLINFRVITPK